MSYIPLILAGFAASTVVSLALIPLQAIVTPANHSVTEVAFNSSNPTSQIILSSTSAYVPSVSASNHSSESLAYGYYQCDAKEFGQPKFNSCREALHQMPNGWDLSTYGDRTVFGGGVDFPMPVRYASRIVDGACIIEVFAAKQGAMDRLEPSHLKMRIRYLLDKCVGDEKLEGGIAKYLG
ncbi:hypothetical protein HO133_010852 [Letharia lupina]|uniref:Uncharacterized protein n=1 Tax=Letharia lupina TaxID=560253 RepID=A0A8H6CIX3_9LECA|nr:uncharacterized protein HO133_010852 [Letharia lupina]KAF6224277.1 hypothetical protein HO133_010852 [Letharia lupina]